MTLNLHNHVINDWDFVFGWQIRTLTFFRALFTITYYLPKARMCGQVNSEAVKSKNPEYLCIRDFWYAQRDSNPRSFGS